MRHLPRAISIHSLHWPPQPAQSSPIALASATGLTTDDFVQDLRRRVLGAPEISTDGWHSYKLSIRDAFRNSAHGVIIKTVAVVDLRQNAAHRYSPAEVIAVE